MPDGQLGARRVLHTRQQPVPACGGPAKTLRPDNSDSRLVVVTCSLDGHAPRCVPDPAPGPWPPPAMAPEPTAQRAARYRSRRQSAGAGRDAQKQRLPADIHRRHPDARCAPAAKPYSKRWGRRPLSFAPFWRPITARDNQPHRRRPMPQHPAPQGAEHDQQRDRLTRSAHSCPDAVPTGFDTRSARGRTPRDISPGPERRGGRLMSRSRLAAAGLLLITAAAVVSGCSSGRTSPAPAPSPTVSLPSSSSTTSPSTRPSPADPRAAAVAEAVAAYRGMWRAYNEAVKVPDPRSPALARHATGGALRTLVSGLTSVKDKGLRGTGNLSLSPKVTELSPADTPTRIRVTDCFNDGRTRLVRASPGPTYKDTPGGRRLCLATAQRQADGSWKVTEFGLQGVGTC
jgi:hypothetical protein